jgi:hypothetical protein
MMDLYHIRRHSVWADEDELAAATERSKQVGRDMSDRLRWIRSYVVREEDGRIGCVCLYQARDADAIREHGRRIGAPSEDFHIVTATAIVNDDPQQDQAA